MQKLSVAIVGGGIVGLASGWRLATMRPDLSIAILEKEPRLAAHQTGHNSGVIHSGIYYKPGSLKAINCRLGKLALQDFCTEQGLPFELCGKVIVAVDREELPALGRIYERGLQNGVDCRMIEAAELHDLEPYASGIQAIHVPEAGIVNYRAVCERLGKLLEDLGHSIHTSCCLQEVIHQPGGVRLLTSGGEFSAALLVNCSGLQNDRITRLSGDRVPARIVPFRGEYYELKPEAERFCRNLIYPVPDPKFPFLGVHFTRMIAGGIECGPNAVLAFAREGYGKLQISPGDLWESLSYGGFQRLALRHWKMGLGEMWRSFNKAAFVRSLQRLVPEIRGADLRPAPAGIRAQAVLPDGSLVDDFLITESACAIHINNAPSPAATAALNIGTIVAKSVAARFPQ